MQDSSYEFSLYSTNGERKYLNEGERCRVLTEARATLAVKKALFALTLAWTGARVSEVLGLQPCAVQLDRGVIAFRTLKRRKFVVREVPVPPELTALLDDCFHIRERQGDCNEATTRLFPWSRATGWRIVKAIMQACGVTGRRACPRGLRHAFGVGTLQSGIPLNLIQRWMGHARISTTAIYASVCGPEEIKFAEQFWRGTP